MTPFQHLNLLLRFDRTFNLQKIVQGAIRKGDRVLDAGCGLGILSQWAAMQGADSVDAVDLSDLTLSKALADENGVSNRINFHQKNLHEFMEEVPPNSYDCIIAMVYMNDPRRDEAQSRLVQQLNSRLLAGGGTMVPDRVEYSFAVYDWPEQDRMTRKAGIHDRIQEIEGRYGLSFRGLEQYLHRTPCHEYFPERGLDGRLNLDGARMLCLEQPAFTIDYANNQCSYPEVIRAESGSGGYANTVVWSQRIMAQGNLIFSNQSVGWISNAQAIGKGQSMQFRLDDGWRNENLLVLEC